MEQVKFVLGTAQLGFDYGINNLVGKPSAQEAYKILKTAYRSGISELDTASAYGESEKIIGQFIQKHKTYKFKVVSKVKIDKTIRDRESYKTIKKCICRSLANLHLDSLHGCLLHEPQDMYNQATIQSLIRCQQDGLFEHIGVSTYEEKDALYATNIKEIDYIQIPYNVFDTWLDQTSFFDLAKKNHKAVYARSIYIQGLLSMDINKIPTPLARIKQYIAKFDKIIKPFDLNRKQAAMLFVYRNPNINKVIFGAESPDQVEENISIIENKVYIAKMVRQIRRELSGVDKKLIRPYLWPKETNKY